MTLKNDILNMYRHDFASFMHCAFNILHPYHTYQDNWHIHAMAHRLNQVKDGQVKKLLITLPPGMLKSECVSVSWVAWMLGRDPRLKILCLNAGLELGYRLHDLTYALMKSARYRGLFEQTDVTEGKRKLKTGYGGVRQFMPMTSKITGLHPDIVIIDDPISALDVLDDQKRQAVNEQFDHSVVQRLKPSGAIIVIMQRLHPDDLAAHVMKKPGWVHLDLPAIALADETWDLPHGRRYHRKKGDVLHPTLQSEEQLLEILRQIKGYAFAYQYLQGQYEPRFGMEQEGGCTWISPMREGVFWDARKDSGFTGFVSFTDTHFILPRVFGIGEDPAPPNMRYEMTPEEWIIAANIARERMLEHQRKREQL